MKKINQDGPFYAGYYLLERLEDYEAAILDYLQTRKLRPAEFGLQRFTLDDLVQLHRVKGNRQSLEHEYPHVLVINYIDSPCQLVVNFVPKNWFDITKE